MELTYILEKDDKYISTYNGQEFNDIGSYSLERFERKHNVKVFSSKQRNPYPEVILIKDNTFFKYIVSAISSHSVQLTVFQGFYEDKIVWKEVYSAIADINYVGIVEHGDCDISFWHEFFAIGCGYLKYSEKNIEQFSENDSMQELRKVFTTQLYPNPFLFFEKYKSIKKYFHKTFDKNIFDIPPIKINKFVGKKLNSKIRFSKPKIRNYAWQREIVLDDEVFWDITVISGYVTDGIMDISGKHRFFVTDGFAYSPDGGDLSVFIDDNLFGDIHWRLMAEKHPNLMLDKYKGKYPYQFFFSRDFCPAFEIIAKSGYTEIADWLLSDYYDNGKKIDINLYGNNDKEILGFKLSKLKNFSRDIFYEEKREPFGLDSIGYRYSFNEFYKNINYIVKNFSYLLEYNLDYNLFEYILKHENVSVKDIFYLKKIGTENCSLYSDYIHMCSLCNRYSGGIYPTNLKHEHDVMVSYLAQVQEAKNNEMFSNVVNSSEYQSLLYEDSEYCILAPRTADDLVNESYSLSHCVRTYISSVALGHTKIYFLRLVEKKAKSLVTLEVSTNRKLVQARGLYNRDISIKEANFLQKWCNEKNIFNNVF